MPTTTKKSMERKRYVPHSIDIQASFDLSSYCNRSHQILVGGNATTADLTLLLRIVKKQSSFHCLVPAFPPTNIWWLVLPSSQTESKTRFGEFHSNDPTQTFNCQYLSHLLTNWPDIFSGNPLVDDGNIQTTKKFKLQLDAFIPTLSVSLYVTNNVWNISPYHQKFHFFFFFDC